MSSFEDRKKNFENKFAHDEELKFKVNSRRNKYLGEWAAEILEKKDKEKEQYILDVIKSDFSEPAGSLKSDFITSRIYCSFSLSFFSKISAAHSPKYLFLLEFTLNLSSSS